MRLRGWPRTIRSQLLGGLILLEVLSLLLFGSLLLRRQASDSFNRAQQRLQHQATSMAQQAQEALSFNRPEAIQLAVDMMGAAPSVATTAISDPQGKVLYFGIDPHESWDTPEKHPLAAGELAAISHIPQGQAHDSCGSMPK